MKKYFLSIIFIFFLLLVLPLIASAIEYPFGNMSANPTPCEYISVIFVWGLGIVGAVAVTSIAYGGFRYMVGQVQEGKEIIYSALLGLLLLMASWLILYTINPDLATLNCQASGASGSTSTTTSPTSVPASSLTTEQAQEKQNYELAGVEYTDQNKALLEKNALSPEYSTLTANSKVSQSTVDYVNNATNLNGVDKARVAAIIQAESSGNTNAIHQDVDGKSSYGLMQIRVGTARDLDPQGTSGLTDDQVANKLMSDPNYNINLGTKYYSDLSTQYNGNTDLAHAAYNGGPVANNPSVNCPGLKRWQCEYDNNAHTVANTGYAPTRTYVSNINSYVNSF
jgi:soluble lytic murein transglycosylase-like protein